MIYYIQKLRRKTLNQKEGLTMASKAELENALRNEILEVCRAALSEHFDLDPVKQIRNVSAGEITLPLCDAEGNEKFALIKVSIPRGSRDGNGGYNAYDGYEAHEEWELVKADKADKEAKRKEKAEREAAEKERKRAARKTVKKLNTVGLNALIHEQEDE